MVAVLFARSDSHYKQIPGCDVYDIERDARTWPGGAPVVAHPPCRAWGNYKAVAKPRPGEKELARWAMEKVRQFGGVLEHPIGSDLWKEFNLLGYGIRDSFGGVLIPVFQSWFGHRAMKETGLYMVGCQVPEMADFSRMARSCDYVPVERMGRAERERTPLQFAQWLVDLAKSCEVN